MRMNNLQITGTQTVNGQAIKVIEGGFGEGQKCMLASDIAKQHEVELFNVNKLINNNIERFGKNDLVDFLNSSKEFRNFAKENGLITSNRVKNIFLLSERGYTKLVAMMDNTNEKKWEVMDMLIDGYFQMRKAIKTMTFDSILESMEEFNIMRENMERMKRNMKLMQNNLIAAYEEVEEVKKLSGGLYLMIEEQKEDINNKIKYLGEVYEAVNDSKWRERTDKLLKSTAYELGNISCIVNLRRKVYELMEQRLNIKFDNLINRRAKRMSKEGVCESKINKINPMTIISDDKKLIDSYVGTVKEVCIAFRNGWYVIAS